MPERQIRSNLIAKNQNCLMKRERQKQPSAGAAHSGVQKGVVWAMAFQKAYSDQLH
jgi:hypothetical protein